MESATAKKICEGHPEVKSVVGRGAPDKRAPYGSGGRAWGWKSDCGRRIKGGIPKRMNKHIKIDD
jgi:hypothetical protein